MGHIRFDLVEGHKMKVGDLVKHEVTGTVGLILRMPEGKDRASNMMTVMRLGSITQQRWKVHLSEVVTLKTFPVPGRSVI